MTEVSETKDTPAPIPPLSDHAKGCEGRNYTCTCGYDEVIARIVSARMAPAGGEGVVGGVLLTADEKHIGVIQSIVPESSDDNSVSVKQWRDNNDLITFGIFIGNHRWAECNMLPADAAKVAALILSKPAVAALSTATPPVREMTANVELLRRMLDKALTVLDGYADPTGYTDGCGEILSPDAEVHEGVLARETAKEIRAALAAAMEARPDDGTEVSREALKTLRMKVSMTQDRFAEVMGVPLRTYQDLETGKSAVRAIHMNAARWAVWITEKNRENTSV